MRRCVFELKFTRFITLDFHIEYLIVSQLKVLFHIFSKKRMSEKPSNYAAHRQ